MRQSIAFHVLHALSVLVIGGVITYGLYYTVADLYKWVRLWSNGVETRAEVTFVHQRASKEFSYVIYEYLPPGANSSIMIQEDIGIFASQRIYEGATIKILYDPADPKVAGITRNYMFYFFPTLALIPFLPKLFQRKRYPPPKFKFRPEK
jgi:hypothetical protein